MVREGLSGNKENKSEGKEENKAAGKKTADRPKKKSNLIQVFRPQNAMTQEGKNFRRNKPAGNRPQQGAGKEQPEKTAEVQNKAAAKPAPTTKF